MGFFENTGVGFDAELNMVHKRLWEWLDDGQRSKVDQSESIDMTYSELLGMIAFLNEHYEGMGVSINGNIFFDGAGMVEMLVTQQEVSDDGNDIKIIRQVNLAKEKNDKVYIVNIHAYFE